MLSNNKSILNMLKELKQHNLLYQSNIKAEIVDGLNTFYYGIDTNTNFIHLGHLSNLFAIKIISKYIDNFILLLGDLTCKIGDPTAKQQHRLVNDSLDTQYTSGNIEAVITNILNNFNIKYTIVRNSSWLNMDTMSYIKISSLFNVKTIYNSEIFQNRLNANQPIYLHEFIYSTLQAYDYLYLYKNYNCRLQIGGQDQWTNILAGGQLIRQVCNVNAYTITTPLVVDLKGAKISKTDKNGISINLENNIFYTFNNLLNVDNYLQSKISDMAKIKFDNYIHFASWIISLIYNKQISSELTDLYKYIQQDENYVIDINKYKNLYKYFVSVTLEECTIGNLIKKCILKSNSEMVNIYISKGSVFINGRQVSQRNIKDYIFTDKINILKIKQYYLIFYVKQQSI